MRVGMLLFLAAATAFPQGIITTVAGVGAPGFGGDGGPATSAVLNFPGGVAADRDGNLFIADLDNQRIRKVNAAGIITTVAGDGRRGYSGDGGPATAASLNLNAGIWGLYSGGIAVDGAGNIYIADAFNHRVRKVGVDGNIHTIAGNGVAGFSGDNDHGSVASLSYPTGVAVDPEGSLYVSDAGNGRIRKIATDGTIITVAIGLSAPKGVAVDRVGNLYVANTESSSVVRITSDGVSKVIGGVFDYPWGVAIDPAGHVVLSDSHAQRLKRISPDGKTVTIAGSAERIVEPITGESWVPCGSAGDGGVAVNAMLCDPLGVAIDAAGNIYVADAGNNSIRKISAPSGSAVDAPPSIRAIANAASFVRGIVPGGVILHAATNQLVTASAPAAKGEVVSVYATGLGGLFRPPPGAGVPAPSDPLSCDMGTPVATVGGLNAEVLLSCLAPGFVGLNQINVRIPTTASSGSVDITLSSWGLTPPQTSKAVKVWIQ